MVIVKKYPRIVILGDLVVRHVTAVIVHIEEKILCVNMYEKGEDIRVIFGNQENPTQKNYVDLVHRPVDVQGREWFPIVMLEDQEGINVEDVIAYIVVLHINVNMSVKGEGIHVTFGNLEDRILE